MYKNGLFIFRRDLRIQDNVGLYNAMKSCKQVYTIFIFTPEQVTKNSYKSTNAVQFMIESLGDLQKNIEHHGGKLVCFYGKNKDVVLKLCKMLDIDAVFFNKDYTPYAKKRDSEIVKVCEQKNIDTKLYQDYYLYTPGTVLTQSGTPYKKFTPFYNTALDVKVVSKKHTVVNTKINIVNVSTKLYTQLQKTLGNKVIDLDHAMKEFTTYNENILVHGGREYAMEKYKKLSNTSIRDYGKNRNLLTMKTSELSAYLKFGCLSIREVFHKVKKHHGISHDLIRQFIWRDFYAHLLDAFPYVIGNPMKEKYEGIQWENNTRLFNAWKKGKTGFPIVDAGMRQMNETGYMHNRARLIVASFLIKTLLIDWEKGEKYFAQTLTDYDPASNNGNWQWVASTGADSQPYFRIFSPWSQSKRFDNDGEYIKQWVPELKQVDAKDLHEWNTSYKKYPRIHYPSPIVDYSEQRKKALKLYNDVLQ